MSPLLLFPAFFTSRACSTIMLFARGGTSNLQSNLPMQPSRIAKLLEPYLGGPDARRLTPDALSYISTYIDLLQRWNARINLTAIRNEEEIVTRHFGESLFAARHLFPERIESAKDVESLTVERLTESDLFTPPQAAQRRKNAAHGANRGSDQAEDPAPEGRKKPPPTLADVGSGAGFPGIPIKLWAPEIVLTLIESNQKKATFLREVARALTLTNINIQTARAESLAPATFDVVTLRAVERFEIILPVAASLVAPGGHLALLIGSPQLPAAKNTLSTWRWQEPQPIPGSQSRLLSTASRSEPI